jgi:hypothetical protein
MLLNDDFFKDEEVFGRNLLTFDELPSTDQFSVYMGKEWEIYEIFWNKMH